MVKEARREQRTENCRGKKKKERDKQEQEGKKAPAKEGKNKGDKGILKGRRVVKR